MTIIAFLIGGMIGFSTCAIFSARQYEKGWEDGWQYGMSEGFESGKKVRK
jgi:hypothetical protein